MHVLLERDLSERTERKLKKIVSIATACAAAFAALGFSSAAWLEKRGDDSDVLRLRAAYSDCVKRLESPAENVSIPIETFPDGTVKSRVTAARAHMFPDTGLVWGEKVHVEQFKEGGKPYASLDAENCVIDRKTRTGWVEGSAKMVYGDSSVKGRGIYFSLTNEFIKIFSQSEIRTGHVGLDPRSLIK